MSQACNFVPSPDFSQTSYKHTMMGDNLRLVELASYSKYGLLNWIFEQWAVQTWPYQNILEIMPIKPKCILPVTISCSRLPPMRRLTPTTGWRLKSRSLRIQHSVICCRWLDGTNWEKAGKDVKAPHNPSHNHWAGHWEVPIQEFLVCISAKAHKCIDA